jgi:hypothetical protein
MQKCTRLLEDADVRRWYENLCRGSKLSLSYIKKESEDVEEAVTKSISLIEHLAEMTKTKCVLIIDEFPSIVELGWTKNLSRCKVTICCRLTQQQQGLDSLLFALVGALSND